MRQQQKQLTLSAVQRPKVRSPIRKLVQSNVLSTPQPKSLHPQHVRSFSQQVVQCPLEVPPKCPIVLLNQREPTIFFQYPPICEQRRPLINARPLTEDEIARFDLVCKVLGSAPYKCVLNAFEHAGFRRVDEEDSDEEWNVQWGQGNKNTLKNMNRYQKINHFPGCWNMGRKDLLWLNLSKFKRRFPKEYKFVPNTYLLTYDFDRFITAQEMAPPAALWIKKPCAESRGRGITMVSKKTKVKKDKNYLIMDYIANPHLINGFKYDLRVYVVITSFDPLRIYMYKDGLVRFATSKYSTSSKDLQKRYVHLTNFSVNKLSPNFVKNQNADSEEASKWSHVAYRKKLAELGIDPKKLFASIKDVLLKTCIATEPFMLDSNAKSQEHRNGYFELYGFDVLIDDHLKPWVLEVNVSPSLNSSSPLDKRIKTSLISDVMHLVGVPLWDKQSQRPSTPPKFTHQRNIREISNINQNNCLIRLSQLDIQMLISTVEELHRKGKNFSCIFPNPKTIAQYIDFFEFPRYNNKLIERFYQENGRWLERF